MRDDDLTRDDANDCDATGCEACGLRSTSAGDVNGRLLCGRCFDLEAEALFARTSKPKRSKRAPKPKRPLECPHWDYEDPDPDCECVGGVS